MNKGLCDVSFNDTKDHVIHFTSESFYFSDMSKEAYIIISSLEFAYYLFGVVLIIILLLTKERNKLIRRAWDTVASTTELSEDECEFEKYNEEVDVEKSSPEEINDNNNNNKKNKLIYLSSFSSVYNIDQSLYKRSDLTDEEKRNVYIKIFKGRYWSNSKSAMHIILCVGYATFIFYYMARPLVMDYLRVNEEASQESDYTKMDFWNIYGMFIIVFIFPVTLISNVLLMTAYFMDHKKNYHAYAIYQVVIVHMVGLLSWIIMNLLTKEGVLKEPAQQIFVYVLFVYTFRLVYVNPPIFMGESTLKTHMRQYVRTLVHRINLSKTYNEYKLEQGYNK